jgi:predicted RNase H-like HicB family nuclease
MSATRRVTAFIEREDDGFVALWPEFDIASEGTSIEEARANLIEALTLFFETASQSEVARRSHSEVLVTQLDVPLGKPRVLSGPDACIVQQAELPRSFSEAED